MPLLGIREELYFVFTLYFDCIACYMKLLCTKENSCFNRHLILKLVDHRSCEIKLSSVVCCRWVPRGKTKVRWGGGFNFVVRMWILCCNYELCQWLFYYYYHHLSFILPSIISSQHQVPFLHHTYLFTQTTQLRGGRDLTKRQNNFVSNSCRWTVQAGGMLQHLLYLMSRTTWLAGF